MSYNLLTMMLSFLMHGAAAQNFACHEHLALQLCPDFNLLQGASASGKSAILQAIKCCFTAQCELSQELIRQQWQGSTEVAVKLHNLDGFKYNVYGASVTIKRVLSQQGVAELQLISNAGQVISYDDAEVSFAFVHTALEHCASMYMCW
jgi:recombinational DNA repair ATPase RecF